MELAMITQLTVGMEFIPLSTQTFNRFLLSKELIFFLTDHGY